MNLLKIDKILEQRYLYGCEILKIYCYEGNFPMFAAEKQTIQPNLTKQKNYIITIKLCYYITIKLYYL